MRVTTIARTYLDTMGVVDLIPDTNLGDRMLDDRSSDPDLLGEFAGRACYQAWDLPNPATAENEGYLANIQSQGHYSVLEHSSVSFYVEGVSRALLLELERHRHISFSVESQRYVNTRKAHPEVAVPPLLRGTDFADALQRHYEQSLNLYDLTYSSLRAQGHSVKASREAARAYLPNATPVDFVVTGNLRAWRDVLGKRWHEAADAEIREFAGLVLSELRQVAPNSVQDVPEAPYTY